MTTMNKNIFILLAIGLLSFAGCEEKEDEKAVQETVDNNNYVDIENGLVQYYTFDGENCNDVATGIYNGVAFNAPSYITDTPNGKGRAVFLNSTKKQYINIPYCPVSGEEAYSVALWVKDFGVGTFITTICGNYYNSPTVRVSQDGYFVLHTGGYCNDGRFSSAFQSTTAESYQATGWHHIAITATSTTDKEGTGLLSLYIDGILADNVTLYSGYIKAEGNKMQIGGNADGKFDYWTDPMKIDNIRIYNRCIGAQDVKAIYDCEK